MKLNFDELQAIRKETNSFHQFHYDIMEEHDWQMSDYLFIYKNCQLVAVELRGIK